jgi:hypothetical protein
MYSIVDSNHDSLSEPSSSATRGGRALNQLGDRLLPSTGVSGLPCTRADGTDCAASRRTSQVTPEARRKGVADTVEMQEAVRKDGYQLQIKDIGGSKCTTVVQPPNPKYPQGTVLIQTACHLEKGPYFVTVAVQPVGSRDVLPMEKVASLAEKAHHVCQRSDQPATSSTSFVSMPPLLPVLPLTPTLRVA